jgi:UDP-3-O-[3-hydroxymyristoyl] glucosamine N-acyltransferase
MAQPTFLRQPPSLTLDEIATLTKAHLVDASRAGQRIRGLAALDRAGPMHLVHIDDKISPSQIAATRAGACLVGKSFAAELPHKIAVLRVADPFAAFVALACEFYADVTRPRSWFGNDTIAPSAVVHPTARLEDGVVIDPLAVIGPHVEIGSDTVIGPGVLIAAQVRIGRDCSVGAGATIQHALIGNNVVLQPGCHIGQDGGGFVRGPHGHSKVPQAGRVLIQNGVEIGAGSTIDRGSLGDTVIGEGSKIDNQVQIGHNVWIGRYCLIGTQAGLAGGVTLGDYVDLGAKVGIGEQIQIGDGARLVAESSIEDDMPAALMSRQTGSKPRGPQ